MGDPLAKYADTVLAKGKRAAPVKADPLAKYADVVASSTKATAKVVQKRTYVPALDRGATAGKVTAPTVRDVKAWKQGIGAHTRADTVLATNLPPAALQQLAEKHRGAQTRSDIYRTNPQAAQFLIGPPDRQAARTPFLPGTPQWVAAQDKAAFNEMRDKITSIRRAASGKAHTASILGHPTRTSDIIAQDVARLGQPHQNALLDFAGKAVNTPFSAAGNLIGGRPLEAAKNLGTLGQRGQQASPGVELQKRGLLPKGDAFAQAFDFTSSLLLPELDTIAGARAGVAGRAASKAARLGRVGSEVSDMARAELPGQAALIRRMESAGRKGTPGTRSPAHLAPGMRSGPDIVTNPAARSVRFSARGRGRAPHGPRDLIEANIKVTAADQAAREAAPIGIRVAVPFTGMKVGVDIPILPASVRKLVPAPLRQLADYMRDSFVSMYGPDPVTSDAARSSDDWVRVANGHALEAVVKASKGIPLAERQMAVRVIEKTLKPGEKVPARVRAYAEHIQRVIDDATGSYIAAGGKLRRIEEGYVYHLLAPEDWARMEKDPRITGQRLTLGKDPSFARQRANPEVTIEDLKALGYHPVDDLAEIAFARLAAHNRALADMELVRALQRHHWGGKATEQIGHPSAHTALPEKVASNVGLQGGLVPPEVNETLARIAGTRRSMVTGSVHPTGAAFKRGLKSYNSYVKKWALWTTGYDIRNQVGDMILQLEAGQNPFTALVRGIKVMREAGGGRGGYTPAEIKQLAEYTGAAQRGQIGADVIANLPEGMPAGGTRVKPSSVRWRAQQAIHGARSARENVNRYGQFANLIKREGPILAGRKVSKNLYNHGDVGRAVQFARTYPIVPFGTWIAKNAPAQVRHMLARPRNLAMLNNGLALLNTLSGSPNQQELPDWLRGTYPIPIPGFGFLNGGSWLPQADLTRLAPGPGGVGQFGRDWWSNASPAVQAAVAGMLGTDPRTGEKLRGITPAGAAERAAQMIPGVGPAIFGDPSHLVKTHDASGKVVYVPATTGFGKFLTRALNPAAVTYGNFAAPPSTSSVKEQVLGTVLGARRSKFNDPGLILARMRSLRADIANLQKDMRDNIKNPDVLRADAREIRDKTILMGQLGALYQKQGVPGGR